jgi:antitoxin (DNA-binding transcriptional repressor) of toxin-antitoxin stability system
MKTFEVREVKKHLARLLKDLAAGESFIICKDRKPLAKVTPYVEKAIRRIGFMEGQFDVPDDIDTMFAEDIRSMFEYSQIFPPERE